jgi:hypothetical protein
MVMIKESLADRRKADDFIVMMAHNTRNLMKKTKNLHRLETTGLPVFVVAVSRMINS